MQSDLAFPAYCKELGRCFQLFILNVMPSEVIRGRFFMAKIQKISLCAANTNMSSLVS